MIDRSIDRSTFTTLALLERDRQHVVLVVVVYLQNHIQLNFSFLYGFIFLDRSPIVRPSTAKCFHSQHLIYVSRLNHDSVLPLARRETRDTRHDGEGKPRSPLFSSVIYVCHTRNCKYTSTDCKYIIDKTPLDYCNSFVHPSFLNNTNTRCILYSSQFSHPTTLKVSLPSWTMKCMTMKMMK